jgi:hypothetical protein
MKVHLLVAFVGLAIGLAARTFAPGLSWFSVNWKIGTLALATQGNDRFG